ncbi:MAG: four helix bundle protein [Candidatus Spechtbacterales bacterium]
MVDKKYLKLNDVSVYRVAFELSNYVWNIVVEWDVLAKKTIGEQFIRSVDSISANIAEGFGRYFKKDKIKFYRYSFSSVQESLDWNEKAKIRHLVTKEQYEHIFKELNKLPKEINILIKITNDKLND